MAILTPAGRTLSAEKKTAPECGFGAKAITRLSADKPLIFGLTDRGDIFSGAALTMILVSATLALLIGLERVPFAAAGRR